MVYFDFRIMRFFCLLELSWPTISYARVISWIALCLSPCIVSSLERPELFQMPNDHYSNITLSGDLLSFLLPAASAIGSYHLHSQDMWQAHLDCLKIGLTSFQTSRLKKVFKDTKLGLRPNGYHSSFPSKHSSMAFIGARIIHKNFGWSYGAGAYCLAGFTAYSRIEGRYHHARDVIAGAALAIFSDWSVEKVFLNNNLQAFLESSHTQLYPGGFQITHRF